MDGYVLRGVPDQQRTRSNSTVSAGSMGGLGLDGASVASKVSRRAVKLVGTFFSGSGLLSPSLFICSLMYLFTSLCNATKPESPSAFVFLDVEKITSSSSTFTW